MTCNCERLCECVTPDTGEPEPSPWMSGPNGQGARWNAMTPSWDDPESKPAEDVRAMMNALMNAMPPITKDDVAAFYTARPVRSTWGYDDDDEDPNPHPNGPPPPRTPYRAPAARPKHDLRPTATGPAPRSRL